MSSAAARRDPKSRSLHQYPIHPERIDIEPAEDGRYRARFAQHAGDLANVLRLRHAEWQEERGDAGGHAHEDPVDAVSHHLMVEDVTTGEVVASYRLQTWEMANEHHGFSSATEIAATCAKLDEVVELGRASVAREHRNPRVLMLLWQRLAAYAEANRKRYLFGACRSLGTPAFTDFGATGAFERQ